MKKRLFGIVGAAMLASLLVSLAVGQEQTLRSAAGDKWVITAKAGGVNYVQGSVNVAKNIGKSGLLLKGDTVGVGDRVSTGSDGRAEILLNPGSYLRVAENTEFQFKNTELEDLQLLVDRGSVMLEVYAANDFKVTVNTPNQNFDLIDTGVYRVDVDADGKARLEVWKGKAEVGDSVVKKGRTVSGIDGEIAVAKFDRDERDDFEAWSRDRAKELAKGTNELKDKTLRSSLMSSFAGGRWNMYDSFGLWVYDARFGRYCFLPFGYGWASPYGFGFSNSIWWYGLPRAVYYYNPPYDSPRSGPVAGTPPSDGGTPPARSPGRRPVLDQKREPVGESRNPPFVRMQGKGSATGPDPASFDRGPTRGRMPDQVGGQRGPVFNPPTKVDTPPASVEPVAPVTRGVGRVKGDNK